MSFYHFLCSLLFAWVFFVSKILWCKRTSSCTAENCMFFFFPHAKQNEIPSLNFCNNCSLYCPLFPQHLEKKERKKRNFFMVYYGPWLSCVVIAATDHMTTDLMLFHPKVVHLKFAFPTFSLHFGQPSQIPCYYTQPWYSSLACLPTYPMILLSFFLRLRLSV